MILTNYYNPILIIFPSYISCFKSALHTSTWYHYASKAQWTIYRKYIIHANYVEGLDDPSIHANNFQGFCLAPAVFTVVLWSSNLVSFKGVIWHTWVNMIINADWLNLVLGKLMSSHATNLSPVRSDDRFTWLNTLYKYIVYQSLFFCKGTGSVTQTHVF